MYVNRLPVLLYLLVDQLSIVVLHYKTPDILGQCLYRIKRFVPQAQLIVVDTGGNLAQLQSRFAQYSDIQWQAAANHSMAHGINQGLKLAARAFVAHMNADVFIEAETFPRLLASLADPSVGLVGPLARTVEGQPQDMGPVYRFAYRRLRGREQLEISWLSGCLQLIRRETLEQVGGLNSSLRFYNEDIEWCWRIRKAGYRCVLVNTPVLHLGGSSTPSQARFMVEGFRGGRVLLLNYRPRLYLHLHRLAVLIIASLLKHGPDPMSRQAYRLIEKMFQRQAYFDSPFGETLAEANERFLVADTYDT